VAPIPDRATNPAPDQLGPNALGEVPEPGRVADCHLGLLLPPPGPVHRRARPPGEHRMV